jgi:hypothetical protein
VSSPDAIAREMTHHLRPHPFRLRVSVRAMMIIVAIVAILLVAWLEVAGKERRRGFRNKANFHASAEGVWRKLQHRLAQLAIGDDKTVCDAEAFREIKAKVVAIAEYHAAMRRKYQQAASHGWFTVAPDPPPPPPSPEALLPGRRIHPGARQCGDAEWVIQRDFVHPRHSIQQKRTEKVDSWVSQQRSSSSDVHTPP